LRKKYDRLGEGKKTSGHRDVDEELRKWRWIWKKKEEKGKDVEEQ
jgi:hypothetical protein